MANNFYNPSNPWMYNGNGGTANASAGKRMKTDLTALVGEMPV